MVPNVDNEVAHVQGFSTSAPEPILHFLCDAPTAESKAEQAVNNAGEQAQSSSGEGFGL